ncbi:DUF4906 domain-containing protein [uncultured Rikenella sp.]|uniref:DUF4906 domain-containing protein n=1 Tax=uncultured Rikenella sp. TaxID=368003 RepID=UPI0026369B37|nr:DUF4906 domain-containing protein [uncultured Rikenella sp.]
MKSEETRNRFRSGLRALGSGRAASAGVAALRAASVAPLHAASVAPLRAAGVAALRAASVAPLRSAGVAALRAASVAPLRAATAALLLGAASVLWGCSKESPAGGASGERPGGASDVRVTLSLASDGPLHAVDKDAAGAHGAAAPTPGTASAPVCAAGASAAAGAAVHAAAAGEAGAAGASSARGVVNPSIVDEWAVADLWVLQYDMSGGAAGSLAARRYVGSTVQDGATVRVTADLEPMEQARIVVLANVPGMFSESELPTGSTLADLAALTYPVNASSGSALPEEYSSTLPMRGDSGDDLKLETGQTATVRIPLYRLVSKVNFTVDNLCSEGWPRLTLTDISLRNVPAAGSYGRVTAATHASTRYPAAASGNFKDYDVLSDGLGTQCEMLWYLAPNSRGTGIGTEPADKTAANAPFGEGDYCTYAYVQGMMQLEEDAHLIPMSYRVYLGGNATNDYNVWANEAYRIKLTIRKLPADPAEIGHDGFTVELTATEGFHDNTVEGWDILVEGATVAPDPSGGIDYKSRTFTFTVFGSFSGTLPVRITSGGTVLASGNASAGTALQLTLPENTSANGRTVNFEYNPGSWTAIKSGVQAGKPTDTADAGDVWVNTNHRSRIDFNEATSYCSGKGMRLPSLNELKYILANRNSLGLSDLTNPCAYWSNQQNGSRYAYGVEASDSRTTFYHWKTDKRCALCVKDK